MNTVSTLRLALGISRWLAALSLTVTCSTLILPTMAATYIRPALGSPKTLLYIDGMNIYADKGGKKLFTSDDQRNIVTAAGKKLFNVASSGEVHRESDNGLKVGVWEGSSLRRQSESPRILYGGRYAEQKQEFRTKPEGELLFVLEGDSINDFQRTALVFQLHPELLTPSQTEEATATAAVNKAQAQAQHDAAPDTVTGDFMVKSVNGLWAPTKLSLTWAKDHIDIQAPGATALSGSGIKFHEISTDHVVGGLSAGKGQIGIFRYANGQYTGQWRDAGGTAAKADIWKTDSNNSIASIFASKQGGLTFTSAHKALQSDGKTYLVKSDKGQSGYAYQYYDSPENSGLIIALGESSGVFRLYPNGNNLMGEYYAGGAQNSKSVLFLSR